MLTAYSTILVFVLVALAFACVSLIAAYLLRPRVNDSLKRTTYECGIETVGTTEIKTNIRFYLYALLFVLFDVEALFVYPWAVGARRLGGVALLEMLIFLAILFVGLIFAWRKGALTWE
ncbi:MAG: NADH-quinone oxidoreductase subunit A [Elusimicrobia bacterium]|nr:NADH-quinone oxidoreductase subunit A [Elusimicrobiota bacterium]